MPVLPELSNKKKSVVLTSLLFALLFVLFYWLKFSNNTPISLLEGGGGGGEVAVNFGDSEFGSGDNFTSTEAVTPAQATPEEVTEDEILTQENTAETAIIPEAKTADKPKKTTEPKPVVKSEPKPSKSTADALSSMLNGANSGDGNDKTAGNKGKNNGDKNATGYNGGGGSGTGSGGGNGSGQGIGSGSGYGSGSGSGSGNGNGNYQLGNRKALNKPKPNYTCNEQGVVVVQISVDQNGTVIAANPGVRGTTNAAKCLLDQAKIAAMNTKWQADPAAPSKQVGKIIYSFNLTE
jgi:outer membrane biosynthesis protein TonB